MIRGINESQYNIPKNPASLFSEWKGEGITGWRPTATLFIWDPDPSRLICSQAEAEAYLKLCADRWLAFDEANEVLFPLSNDNFGVQFVIKPAQWQAFLDSEDGDHRKARTALIAAALAVNYRPVLDFLAADWRRWVTAVFRVTRFTKGYQRIAWEIGNADLDFWNRNWQTGVLTTKGKSLCAILDPITVPGAVRPNLINLWKRAFTYFERITHKWVLNSAFCYASGEQTSVTCSLPVSQDFVEVGGTRGHLVDAVNLAEAYGAARVYLYAYSWAGNAWMGWKGDYAGLYAASENDSEGYANLANRTDELLLALSA